MQFNIIISGSPDGSQAAYSGNEFAKAVIAAGHTVNQVFFYQSGVTQANELVVPMADEYNALEQWLALANNHAVPLVVCVSASERRGIIDDSQMQEFQKTATNLHPQFTVAGLGVMLEASLQSDRTVTFK